MGALKLTVIGVWQHILYERKLPILGGGDGAWEGGFQIAE